MGTRYNITRDDIIVKMGREIEYDSTTGLRHVVGGIAGWDCWLGFLVGISHPLADIHSLAQTSSSQNWMMFLMNTT